MTGSKASNSQPLMLDRLTLDLIERDGRLFLHAGTSVWSDGARFSGQVGRDGWNSRRNPGVPENLAIVLICFRLFSLGGSSAGPFSFTDFKVNKISGLLSQRKTTSLWHKHVVGDRIKALFQANENQPITIIPSAEKITFSKQVKD